VPEHSGVYRVGHAAPSHHARYMAAVRACGEGAVLSGLSASHLHGLTPAPTIGAEVTAPAERLVPGVLVHRARRVEVEATEKDGIPVTTIARTLVDIASRLDDERLSRACHQAFVQEHSLLREAVDVLERRRNVAGSRRLRRLLFGDDPIVLRRLERRFLEVLEADGIERPVTNVRVSSHRVDCHWPHLNLIVELDSYRFHGSRQSWERDHRREREARRDGNELLRYTSEDVFELPEAMLVELRPRLTRARSRPKQS
jgi:very-short-patch-repair endonuclease